MKNVQCFEDTCRLRLIGEARALNSVIDQPDPGRRLAHEPHESRENQTDAFA
jgi:hypothetical protein